MIRRPPPRLRAVLLLAVVLLARPAAAQPQDGVATLATPVPADQVATVRFNNRPITVLRARILSRLPAERAAAAARVLDTLAVEGRTMPVTYRMAAGIGIVSVAGRDALTIVPADLDELVGETLDGRLQSAAAATRQALDEAAELRRPRQLMAATAIATFATLGFVGIVILLRRLQRTTFARMVATAERELHRIPGAASDFLPTRGLAVLAGRLVAASMAVLGLVAGYLWLTFVLRRFPYTRPWGEGLRDFLFSRIATLALSMLHAIPGLFTVVLIFFVTRWLVKLSNGIFDAIAAGRIAAPDAFAETAVPSRRLVAALLWAFALIEAYPFLPGSESDAFKGVSIFIGLIVSLGSTGVVNQILSSFTLTYARALRPGEYVRVGEVEGTVTQVGVLATKVRTPRREEVTIPNAVVLAERITNYSRLAGVDGVYVPATVGVGYDVPWRQVQALLLRAAARTAGVRSTPRPQVQQTMLDDFAVRYTLLVSLESPELRVPVLGELHGRILDAFNEFGVQIMVPSYEGDPEVPKVVPPERWAEAPATDGDLLPPPSR